MNNSRHSGHHSFHLPDRDRERETDGGGFYGGNAANGSPPTNISSPASSYYNLQMYSTPSQYNTLSTNTNNSNSNYNQQQPQLQQAQNSSFNLYQSLQEVFYHPPLDHRSYPVRSTPSPSQSASTGSSSSSGAEFNKVHKNGITFVDPFTPPTSTTKEHLNNNCINRNINNNNNTTVDHVRINCEPVVQPIYATFGTESIFVTCPYCHNTDSTEIEQVIGSEAMLWACIIPFAGFLRKSKWDTRHRCKNCLNVIGTYYP